ncbi:MAG: efflux transporter outer membrane subunit [Cardiobacteriaceae bacterium]|nr:efflux transporter outer membrane subunit [Cardiobacteriaceae bacterium]
MYRKIIYTAIFSALFLTACSSINPLGNAKSDVENTSDIPADWLNKYADRAQKHKNDWWRNFGNAKLNSLIEEALANNQDLAASAIAWKKTRLQIDSAELDQSVSFNGSMSTSASRRFSGNQNSHSFGSGLSASYQLDLWNKLEISTQNAIWTANASAEDLLASKLSLQGEVANAYIKLVYINEKLRINTENLKTQERTYQIVASKVKYGKASEVDRLNAEQSLASLKNSRTALIAEEKQAQNALTVLLGGAPKKFAVGTAKLNDFKIPKISAEIPAELLRQRPDLRAAQYRLQNDLATIAINERDFYPDLSLSASLSAGGSLLREIFQNPAASIGTSIALPFLQYREKNITLKSSKLQYEADLAKFRNTLYKAFADVEDALISLHELRLETPQVETRFKNAKKLAQLSEIRYKAGKDALSDLLSAQQNLRSVEQEMLDNRYQHLTRSIQLYLALGGDAKELQNNIFEINKTVSEKKSEK